MAELSKHAGKKHLSSTPWKIYTPKKFTIKQAMLRVGKLMQINCISQTGKSRAWLKHLNFVTHSYI